MRADLQLRQTLAPRGLIIGTAEQLRRQSIQARLFQVKSTRMITRGADSPLTLRKPRTPRYIHTQWPATSNGWPGSGRPDRAPDRLLTYTEAAREKHLRCRTTWRHLWVGNFPRLLPARKVVTDTGTPPARAGVDGVDRAARRSRTWRRKRSRWRFTSALQPIAAPGALYLRSRAYPTWLIKSTAFVRAANASSWAGTTTSTLPASKVALRVVHKFYRQWGGVSRYRARGEGEAERLLFPAESGANPSTSFPLRSSAWLRISNFLSADNEALPENT